MTVFQVYNKIFSSALLEGLKTAVAICKDNDGLNLGDNLYSRCDIMEYGSTAIALVCYSQSEFLSNLVSDRKLQ